MDLNQDYKEFIESLNENKVEYLLVGGYAVIYYGYPRLTLDMDIWVNPSEENAQKIIHALVSFEYPTQNINVQDFSTPDTVFQIGVAPVRIDILTSIEGVSFDEAFNNKVSSTSDGIEIYIIGLEDLKKNKKAVGRYKDLDDLEKL
ncbi:MAG: nucleotidyltransferase [Ignavibacteriae bacterium]|nr:nucleotidyltransferase [Ignavibacteriota bacterium]